MRRALKSFDNTPVSQFGTHILTMVGPNYVTGLHKYGNLQTYKLINRRQHDQKKGKLNCHWCYIVYIG